MSPTLNFRYCSKLVIGRLSCSKYRDRLAKILWGGGGGGGVDKHLCGAQQTRGFDLMLFQYWPSPVALDQH